eukprot:251152-Chlamydomonas_euryale.AAC.9
MVAYLPDLANVLYSTCVDTLAYAAGACTWMRLGSVLGSPGALGTVSFSTPLSRLAVISSGFAFSGSVNTRLNDVMRRSVRHTRPPSPPSSAFSWWRPLTVSRLPSSCTSMSSGAKPGASATRSKAAGRSMTSNACPGIVAVGASMAPRVSSGLAQSAKVRPSMESSVRSMRPRRGS